MVLNITSFFTATRFFQFLLSAGPGRFGFRPDKKGPHRASRCALDRRRAPRAGLCPFIRFAYGGTRYPLATGLRTTHTHSLSHGSLNTRSVANPPGIDRPGVVMSSYGALRAPIQYPHTHTAVLDSAVTRLYWYCKCILTFSLITEVLQIQLQKPPTHANTNTRNAFPREPRSSCARSFPSPTAAARLTHRPLP